MLCIFNYTMSKKKGKYYSDSDRESSKKKKKKSDYDPLIYNENNILIKKSEVEKLINKFLKKKNRIKIKDVELYRTALTHKSYTFDAYIYDKDVVTDAKSNSFLHKKKKYVIAVPLNKIKKPSGVLELRQESLERLEFLGDSVIHLAVGNYLFTRYKKEPEGFLTKLRTKIENGEMTSKFSEYAGLAKYILMAKQIEMTKGRKVISILEDTFEAFVGAIYKEHGYYVCNEYIITLIEESIDITELISNDTNYKEQLIKCYHEKKWGHPNYVDISSEVQTDDNKKIFKIYVTDNKGYRIGTGIAGSKKKAEQLAAKKALSVINSK